MAFSKKTKCINILKEILAGVNKQERIIILLQNYVTASLDQQICLTALQDEEYKTEMCIWSDLPGGR